MLLLPDRRTKKPDRSQSIKYGHIESYWLLVEEMLLNISVDKYSRNLLSVIDLTKGDL